MCSIVLPLKSKANLHVNHSIIFVFVNKFPHVKNFIVFSTLDFSVLGNESDASHSQLGIVPGKIRDIYCSKKYL
jgi:hypothetical protein